MQWGHVTLRGCRFSEDQDGLGWNIENFFGQCIPQPWSCHGLSPHAVAPQGRVVLSQAPGR